MYRMLGGYIIVGRAGTMYSTYFWRGIMPRQGDMQVTQAMFSYSAVSAGLQQSLRTEGPRRCSDVFLE